MFMKLKIPSQRIANKNANYLVSMTSLVHIMFEQSYIVIWK